MDNFPYHKSHEIQQAFEDVGHIYLRLPSYRPFLNVAYWIFGHINSHIRWNDLQNHQTLLGHINDDVQPITTNMVQDWIGEVNKISTRVSHGEQQGESYT